jgi:hypothetical protein
MTINGSDDMPSKGNRGKPEAEFLSVLRSVALIALLVGALGSVGLTLLAGRRKGSPLLLLGLFAIWVLSPFVALAWVNMVSKRWSVIIQATLYSTMLVLTLSSLAIYADVALGPLRVKTAFAFVVVPPASWLFIAIVVSIAALISR